MRAILIESDLDAEHGCQEDRDSSGKQNPPSFVVVVMAGK